MLRRMSFSKFQKLTSCVLVQSMAFHKYSGGGAVAILGGGALFKSCVFEQNEAPGAEVSGKATILIMRLYYYF